MIINRSGDSLTVDIHGMRVENAKFRLESIIQGYGGKIRKIIVIHGCNNGHALMDMVRSDLKSSRIKSIESVFANDGQTVITLQ